MTKITPEHLVREAVVYVRQSTAIQVVQNLESQRRQYGLADRARQLGWADVEVIDDDLGRSGARRATARLREASGRDLRGPRRRRTLAGSLPVGAQRARLAHAAGILRPGRHADRRRGRHLRPDLAERPAPAWYEGHDERDGAFGVSSTLDRSDEAEGTPRRTLPHRGGRAM